MVSQVDKQTSLLLPAGGARARFLTCPRRTCRMDWGDGVARRGKRPMFPEVVGVPAPHVQVSGLHPRGAVGRPVLPPCSQWLPAALSAASPLLLPGAPSLDRPRWWWGGRQSALCFLAGSRGPLVRGCHPAVQRFRPVTGFSHTGNRPPWNVASAPPAPGLLPDSCSATGPVGPPGTRPRLWPVCPSPSRLPCSFCAPPQRSPAQISDVFVC